MAAAPSRNGDVKGKLHNISPQRVFLREAEMEFHDRRRARRPQRDGCVKEAVVDDFQAEREGEGDSAVVLRDELADWQILW